MTKDQETILMIKGAISQLPLAQRETCEKLAEHIRMEVIQSGPIGMLALALVGAEMQENQPE